MQPNFSSHLKTQSTPENIRLWCSTRTSTPNVRYTRTATRCRGLNVFEIYFTHLRETRLHWESLPNSSLLPTKLATRLTHLNLI